MESKLQPKMPWRRGAVKVFVLLTGANIALSLVYRVLSFVLLRQVEANMQTSGTEYSILKVISFFDVLFLTIYQRS